MTVSKVDIVGGGPAGLYSAVLLRRRMPQVRVRVFEQNPPGATFGFGVVFSDQALKFIAKDDPEIYRILKPKMEQWRDMTLHHPEGTVTLDGVGFAAIGRLELNEVFRRFAESLGVELHFSHAVSSLDELTADLIIGADGLNSLVRRSFEPDFKPQLEYFTNHFAWYGADRAFDTLTQTFIETPNGAMNAHHYRYAPGQSTFIVECGQSTFEAYGFAEMPESESARICAGLFSRTLSGSGLVTNNSMWRSFPRLWCKRWVSGRHVLLGDAAHTAHFSIGSGTRLAMEDAIALVQSLCSYNDMESALTAYETERMPIAKKIVDAANTSANWYESFAEKMKLSKMDFAFDYLTRSGRVDMNRLHQIAPNFAAQYERERGQ